MSVTQRWNKCDQEMHSMIINMFYRAKKISAVKDCNKNGAGRMPEFRRLNLKISYKYHYLSLNYKGCWGTTDDFTTNFLHFFPCSPLPSGTWWTPGLSIPWGCLPTSFCVRLVFFPLSLCLARWFGPDLMNGKHVHTTAVCISLRLSGDLHVVQLPAWSWHGLPHW